MKTLSKTVLFVLVAFMVAGCPRYKTVWKSYSNNPKYPVGQALQICKGRASAAGVKAERMWLAANPNSRDFNRGWFSSQANSDARDAVMQSCIAEAGWYKTRKKVSD